MEQLSLLGTCEHCGQLLPQRGARRPARFCSSGCRQAAYRKRQSAQERENAPEARTSPKDPAGVA